MARICPIATSAVTSGAAEPAIFLADLLPISKATTPPAAAPPAKPPGNAAVMVENGFDPP